MAKHLEVKVGDRVQDRLTGLTGIAWGITEYLAGCRRVHIQPEKLKEDGSVHESTAFDEPMITILEKQVCLPDKDTGAQPRPTGGPSYLDPKKKDLGTWKS